MILVDYQIKQRIEDGTLGITPYNEDSINPNSYDLHLSNQFKYYINNGQMIDPYDRNTIIYGHEVVEAETFTIQPGMFMLAVSQETITLPKNICAACEGKSSLARLGLTIHQTGGWIDAGFGGTLTFELYNVNNRPIRLYSGMPIAQLVFFEGETCRVGYNEKSSSKYKNQTGATLSRYHLNRV